jgi:tRNA A-37 threonylcarbamoyl transferase component Bud32
MSDPLHPEESRPTVADDSVRPPPLGPETLRRVEQIREQFEAALKAGHFPPLESLLLDVEAAARPGLLRELLALEIRYRDQAGLPLTADEAGQRFLRLGPWAAEILCDLGLECVNETRPLEGDEGLAARQQRRRARRASAFAGRGGRYHILRPHARGGLGEVFVAEDTELGREVALKEIQAQHADDPAYRDRFVREAEITGGLEHPGVVPVYGLGTNPDGRPYYAMRFIRGESFRDAVERFHAADGPAREPGERSLAFRGLLRRFIDVCNAVAYAHSRGVLHRDLKPGNVMLGPFGETLVVDWGLAKAGVESPAGAADADEATTDPALRPPSSDDQHVTQPGQKLGTPAYMSPEQAAGRLDEVGPASDVYSLGAMLYVLLTGQKPFEGGRTDEVLARVRGGRFAPPRLVKPGTPAALDAVCRKAMALRPDDRYATALGLAADVEHWLADEPTTAYRDPWAARAARWARRHRTAVAAAAVFLVMAVVALAVSTALVWREQQKTAEQKLLAEQNAELARERQRDAEQNFELARDVSFNGIAVVESLEADLAAEAGLHAPRKDLLMAGGRVLRQSLEQRPDDARLQRQLAQVVRYAANVHRLTYETEPAEPLYVESVRLYEGLGERERLSETLRDYAAMQALAGRLRESADTAGRAVAIAEKLREEGPDRPTARRLLATALLEQAGIEYARGKVADARRLAGQSADLLNKLRPEEVRPYDPLLLGAALNRAAMAEREAGDTKAALAHHEQAIQLLRTMADRRPARVNRADILHVQARCRLERCRTWVKAPPLPPAAELNMGETAQQWEVLARNYPMVPAYREWQAIAYLARGQLRAAGNRADEARADFDRSRQLLEELVKEYPALPTLRGDLGRAYAGLGRLARRAKNASAADEWFVKAADALGQAVRQSPESAQEVRSLADVLAEQGAN